MHRVESHDNVLLFATLPGSTKILLTTANMAAHADDRTALQLAAASGDLQTASELLAQGADVKAADSAGVTPLHDAAAAGHADMVQVLLQAGAAVTAARTEDAVTPLHLAAQHGHAQVLQLLLQSGATDVMLDSWEDEQCSGLMAAAMFGHGEAAEALIAAASADKMAGEYGFWALVYAAKAGNAGITELLLAAGAPKQCGNEHALLYAASAGSAGTTKVLLDAGADVEAKGLWCPSQGSTAMPFSSADVNVTALHAAAAVGASGVTTLLLHRGASPQAEDCYKRTPLHFAAAFSTAAPLDQHAVLQLLLLWLDAPGDLDAVDDFGNTALHYAAFRGWLEGVRLLLDHGANVEGAALDGDTCLRPLHAAVFAGEPEVVQALLAAGVDVSAVYISWTPLQLAALLLRPKVVDCLVHHTKPTTEEQQALLPAAVHEGRAALQSALLEQLQQDSVQAAATLASLSKAWQEASAPAVDMFALRRGVQGLIVSMAAAAKQQHEELATRQQWVQQQFEELNRQQGSLRKQRRQLTWQHLCCSVAGVLTGLTAAAFWRRRDCGGI